MHPRVLPQVHERQVQGVGYGMRNHRHGQITSASQVQSSEQPVPNILNHACGSLVEVATSEDNTHHNRAQHPCHFRIAKNSGDAIHQVAAIIKLLT
jgi:hypothetical protein